MQEGFDSVFGARPLHPTIERQVTNPLIGSIGSLLLPVASSHIEKAIGYVHVSLKLYRLLRRVDDHRQSASIRASFRS